VILGGWVWFGLVWFSFSGRGKGWVTVTAGGYAWRMDWILSIGWCEGSAFVHVRSPFWAILHPQGGSNGEVAFDMLPFLALTCVLPAPATFKPQRSGVPFTPDNLPHERDINLDAGGGPQVISLPPTTS
jgi:hypothetical protein